MTIQHWQQRFEQWLEQHHNGDDAAHDIAHFRRVWCTAQQLAGDTDANLIVILTACYFHDIVSLPKNHPDRSRSSRLSAEKTRILLTAHFSDFPATLHDEVAHAIAAHSFSAELQPVTLEAKIVQDADRLEALGAIGLSRVFAVAGSLNQALFDSDDPLARHRKLNDRQFALDHFQTKLLTLPDTMQTAKGRAMAEHNAQFLVRFMAKLSAELQGDLCGLDSNVLQQFTRAD